MERWYGKTAVVTGASSGIGAGICVGLANAGLRVIGLARRANLVDKLQSTVEGGGTICSRQCDVSKPEDVTETFRWIDENFGAIHTLINNAGVFYGGQITDVGDDPLSEEAILATIDTNLKGTVVCTRLAVASMKRHSFDGHIININSIGGHYIPFHSKFNVYPSTKHGITAFTGALNNELASFKSKIKTTSLSPGLVKTDLAGLPQYLSCPSLQPKDIADAVLYVLSTPPNININELTITTVGEERL